MPYGQVSRLAAVEGFHAPAVLFHVLRTCFKVSRTKVLVSCLTAVEGFHALEVLVSSHLWCCCKVSRTRVLFHVLCTCFKVSCTRGAVSRLAAVEGFHTPAVLFHVLCTCFKVSCTRGAGSCDLSLVSSHLWCCCKVSRIRDAVSRALHLFQGFMHLWCCFTCFALVSRFHALEVLVSCLAVVEKFQSGWGRTL